MTKKIDKLTPKQEEQLKCFYEEWFAIGSAVKCTDRPRAEAAITGIYAKADLPAPEFIWASGPKEALNIQAKMDGIENPTGKDRQKYLGREWWGSSEVYWIAFYLFPAKYLGVEYERYDELLLWAEVAQSCGWWWPYDNVCICSDLPNEIHWDPDMERPRLHHGDGPTMSFSDGHEVYNWHGVRVSKRIITNPETITIEEINNEDNAEMRRVLLERYGLERYVKDSNMAVIHEDDCGVLLQQEGIEIDEEAGTEPLTVVKVINSTPEPDGTSRRYILPVPPTMKTAREAVAWTFGMEEDEYKPVAES